MKKPLIFLAGIFAGIVGWKLYSLLSRDKSQAWFWIDEWQKGERMVDEYIRKGQVETFDTMDEFVKSLAYDFTEDELIGIDKLFTPDELDELASLEDTQPIYIGESDDTITGYELYIWNGESE